MGVQRRLAAVMGSAIVISAARVVNMAVRRAQLAASNAAPVAFIKSMQPGFCAIERGAGRKVSAARVSSRVFPSDTFPLSAQQSLAMFAEIVGDHGDVSQRGLDSSQDACPGGSAADCDFSQRSVGALGGCDSSASTDVV